MSKTFAVDARQLTIYCMSRGKYHRAASVKYDIMTTELRISFRSSSPPDGCNRNHINGYTTSLLEFLAVSTFGLVLLSITILPMGG